MRTLIICCRPDRSAAEADTGVRSALEACGDREVAFVGIRPGRDLDPQLAGADRLVVIGDDADLAAVVLRLMRRELLRDVIVGFATGRVTAVTDLWSLPIGAGAVRLALAGDPDVVPIVRDDIGGLIIGMGGLFPVRGTVYVDERRVLSGAAAHLMVEPDTGKGLSVTIVPRRILGFGRRPRTFPGRAVQIGTAPAVVVRDGVRLNRTMDKWTFYTHTERLRLARGVL